jgi:hypothetical protein
MGRDYGRQARRWCIVAGVFVAMTGVTWAQGPPRRPGAGQQQPAAQAPPAEDVEPQKPPFPEDRPAATDIPVGPGGFTGEGDVAQPPTHLNIIERPTIAVPDRWRIGWPHWDRYGRGAQLEPPIFMNVQASDIPYTLGHPLNPYDRNVLKGDYPIIGEDIFLNVTAVSDTLFNMRKLPTPSGVSAGGPDRFDFFGDGEQTFVSQTVLLTIDLFQGMTAFRPVDWLVRITPVYNYNYLKLREFNATDIDTRKGDERDDQIVTLQEAFFEYHLGDTSEFFDIAAVRLGRQLFVSDFRGFVFNDVSDGIRFFGNFASNRVQYNLAFFNQNEKDTNSELNELNWRDQQILIANTYIQDFIWLGYTTQFSFHWNHDQSDEEYDNNGFQVIPDLAGSNTLRNVDAFYLGWAGDGHIGRLNVNHALYYVFGKDDANPIAGRSVDISAYMGAIELSIDIDWFRPKVHLLYASGDKDPTDGTATGFDGIFDNPFFAGGASSFYQSQALRLFGVNLVSGRSFYNDLAAPKAEGVANYVNPGTILVGGGFDAELTPKLRTSFNANALWFAHTETLELFLNQNDIDQYIGSELNLALQYRPLLNNNVILTVGGSLFFPGQGFKDAFDTSETLWQVFTGITLTY